MTTVHQGTSKMLNRINTSIILDIEACAFINMNLFYIYKTGKLTVIGFDGKHLSDFQMMECKDQLLELIKQQDCEYLVVDLMDVPVVKSWVLGILASIHSRGVNVELYHPSTSMRDVLKATRLDSMLNIRE